MTDALTTAAAHDAGGWAARLPEVRVTWVRVVLVLAGYAGAVSLAELYDPLEAWILRSAPNEGAEVVAFRIDGLLRGLQRLSDWAYLHGLVEGARSLLVLAGVVLLQRLAAPNLRAALRGVLGRALPRGRTLAVLACCALPLLVLGLARLLMAAPPRDLTAPALVLELGGGPLAWTSPLLAAFARSLAFAWVWRHLRGWCGLGIFHSGLAVGGGLLLANLLLWTSVLLESGGRLSPGFVGMTLLGTLLAVTVIWAVGWVLELWGGRGWVLALVAAAAPVATDLLLTGPLVEERTFVTGFLAPASAPLAFLALTLWLQRRAVLPEEAPQEGDEPEPVSA